MSNGTGTQCYNTHTGDLLNGGLPDEADLAGLMLAALKIALRSSRCHCDTDGHGFGRLDDRCACAATRQTLDELTGDWSDPYIPFTTGYHLPRTPH